VLRQGRLVGDVRIPDVTTEDLVHLITTGTPRRTTEQETTPA
jgi:hypothetical protein